MDVTDEFVLVLSYTFIFILGLSIGFSFIENLIDYTLFVLGFVCTVSVIYIFKFWSEQSK